MDKFRDRLNRRNGFRIRTGDLFNIYDHRPDFELAAHEIIAEDETLGTFVEFRFHRSQ